MSKQTELAQVADTITVDSGNVGIGTSSPQTGTSTYYDDLVIKNDASGTGAGITLQSNNTNGFGGLEFRKADGSSVAKIYASNASGHIGFNVGSEAMRLDSSGNLRVGNTTGSWPSVDGCILQGGGIIQASINNSSSLYLNRGSSNGNVAQFARSSTTVGGISVTTSSTSFNTSSDYRLKENVTDVTDGITRVKQLAPKRFNFIADPDTTVDGFLAHEAQAVVPEAVTGTHDAVDADGNPEYQGIDQSKLVPLLTAALQEAIAKIDDLETRLTALETP